MYSAPSLMPGEAAHKATLWAVVALDLNRVIEALNKLAPIEEFFEIVRCAQ